MDEAFASDCHRLLREKRELEQNNVRLRVVVEADEAMFKLFEKTKISEDEWEYQLMRRDAIVRLALKANTVVFGDPADACRWRKLLDEFEDEDENQV